MTPTHQPLLQPPGLGTTQRGYPRWQPAPVRPARFGRAHCDGGNFACAVGKKGRMSRRKVRPTRILSKMGSREITGRKAPRGRQAPVSPHGRLSGRGLRAGTGHLVVCAIAEAVPIQTHVLSLHARCRWRRGAIWKRKIVYVVSSINRTLI